MSTPGAAPSGSPGGVVSDAELLALLLPETAAVAGREQERLWQEVAADQEVIERWSGRGNRRLSEMMDRRQAKFHQAVTLGRLVDAISEAVAHGS